MIFFILLTIVCAIGTYLASDITTKFIGFLFTVGFGIVAVYKTIHNEESKRRN